MVSLLDGRPCNQDQQVHPTDKLAGWNANRGDTLQSSDGGGTAVMDDAVPISPPANDDVLGLRNVVGDLPQVVPRPSLARGGVLLAAGSATANVLSYVYTLLLSRSLGPAGYGAVAAVLAAGVIAAIPAIALQLVTARRMAFDPAHRDQMAREGVRLSMDVGLVLVVLMSLLSPALSLFLHLGGPLPVVLVALSLLPLTLTGAYQGVLLGGERYGRLSAALALTAAGRLMAAVIAVSLGWGIVGVLGATCVATGITAIAISHLSSVRIRDVLGTAVAPAVREFGRASATMSGLFVLTNVDVLLARHFLPAHLSGVYALGALFAKATFWGSQFVPLLFFPGLAKRDPGRRALLAKSAALTVTLGAACVAGAALLAGPVVDSVVGSRYSDAINWAWYFAVLGAFWALVQLLMLAGLTVPGRAQNTLLWSATSAEVLLISIALHHGIRQILAASLLAAALLLVTVIFVEVRPPRERGHPPPRSVRDRPT